MSGFYGKKKSSLTGSRSSRSQSKGAYASANHFKRSAEVITPKRKKVALQPRNGSSPLRYQPGMSLEEISAQAAMGSTSESEELSDDGYDPLSGPLGLGGALNNSLGDRDRFEQQTFSSPHSSVSLGHTSTPISSVRSGHEGAAGHQSIILMLQKQQAMLQEVLEGQKALEERQDTVESHLAELQSKMEESATSTPSSSDGKRKRVVTRALSNKVYAIHRQLETQYDPTALWSSDHNKAVQQEIVKEVLSQPDCKFTEPTVKAAAKRCYENLRRTFLEQQAGKEEFVEQQSKRRKYRSRRERKFQARTGVVSRGEMEKWNCLSLAYMTEESDDEDNPNGIVEHKLEWRSKKLNDFIAVLDSRMAKEQKMPSGMVAKKVRRQGSPSTSVPPPSAPSWAVKSCAKEANKENQRQQQD